jgi:hypothetical protein
MNHDQRRQFNASLRPTDNDNAKPDYRIIAEHAARVTVARRDWIEAMKANAPIGELDARRETYNLALAAYHTASELYWGRQ